MNDDELAEQIGRACFDKYWEATRDFDPCDRWRISKLGYVEDARIAIALVREHDGDAERYRWLRGNYSGTLELVQAIQMFTPEELDAAIDAARRKE